MRIKISLMVALTLASFSICAQAKEEAPKASIMKNVKVTLTPGSIAKVTTVKVVPAVANNHDEPPFMNGEPEHLRLQFDNDKLSDYSSYNERQLLVYPLQQYGALFKDKEKKEFDEVVSHLNKVIGSKSDAKLKQLPMLPAAEAAEVFHNHLKHLLFKHGKGIAFLSAYAQDASPMKNGDLFYTFQGLTDDGKYYVSLLVPVQVKTMPKDLPPKKAAAFLAKVPANGFTPDLDAIDKMILTIGVQ